MSLALNFYHDQLDDEGLTSSPLPAAHRLLYVRHGAAEVNGRRMSVNEATYCDGPVVLKSTGAWCQIWRWELVSPNAPLVLHQGDGVLSLVRMQRIIANFSMLKGTQWLFRLDRIITPSGGIADRHQHPGPGIRCLLTGTFNVQQSAESHRDLAPGDPWWETGSDTVVAWSAPQMGAKFMRAMVLPTEWQGRVTGEWLSGAAPVRRPGSWTLYVDQIVTL
ncbi:MAG TPA: hypothetical protein VFQ89_04080 [Candidatus Binatia bacterium]|jgi:hypothetical protein|nr:hypothetical protein [Candidatus Binatia bacterium]